MSRLLLISICILVLITTNAQPIWPVITRTAKPWTRWWWQGSAVNRKDLTAAMQLYKEAGLGGMEITPIYGVKGHETEFIDFLSPQWMDMLQYTLAEARRLDLGIDMANATGWPFGGPWVTPADAAKNIYLRMYALQEGQHLGAPISYTQPAFYRSESRAKVDITTLSYPVETNKNLQSYAFDQLRYEMVLKPFAVMAYGTSGETMDLSQYLDSTGILNWTAPKGEWKLYALFTGYHGKMVERAAPGGEGNVIDHFSSKALENYLERFNKAFKGKDITGIRSFFNDSYEVDDARGQANWTPGLLSAFKQRRGYALENYLPLLFARDSTDTGRRVLADYRQTISDLLLDNFTLPWKRWAQGKDKLVRNQSHGSPANILDHYAVVDIPETEGADILRFKFATSVAHVTGKPLASSETATWLNEHFQSSLSDVKQAVDKYFIGGVNHIFWHGTSYSPQSEPWPGWLFYAAVHFTPANPFWKDFSTLNQYVARCQSFLQKGKPDNDVLLYFPFNDRIAEMGKDMLLHFDGMEGFEHTAFKAMASWMLEKGYSFDLISDKQILGISSGNKLLQTGGIAYKTIVLSDVRYIPLETFTKLVSLATQGATIVFYKNMPVDVPGLGDLAGRRAAFKKMMGSLQFSIVDKGVKQAQLGKGSFLVVDDPSKLLELTGAVKETMVEKGLQFTRRSYDGGHYYFISNPGKQRIRQWIDLSVKETGAVLFDPITITAGKAAVKPGNGSLQLFLELWPGESRIIQTINIKSALNDFPGYQTAGKTDTLQTKWKLAFIAGGPQLPAPREIATLVSWTGMGEKELLSFSGSASYTTHFTMPAVKAAYYFLDLGSVSETASVTVNGKKMGVCIGSPYRLILPAAMLGADNIVEITVTNSMANRIAYMDKESIPWKKFYNTNFPSRLPENRGSDGLFTAAKWEPKVSGLLGPVTLTPAELFKP